MIDVKYLAEIKAREQAATPGKWKLNHNNPWVVGAKNTVYKFLRICEVDDSNDANFISHARTDIPALISEVERLSEENTTMKMALGETTRIKNDFFRQMQSYIKAFRSYQSALELAVPDENDREHFLQQAQEREKNHE